jgi:hypothetical protein
MKYECRVLPGGSGTAAAFLAPMFAAWSEGSGVDLHPGTLNLCSKVAPFIPAKFDRLRGDLAPRLQGHPRLSPRLYPIRLTGPNGAEVAAWLFRWTAPEHIGPPFVEDADGCAYRNRWEVVAAVRLRDALGLGEEEGAEVVAASR